MALQRRPPSAGEEEFSEPLRAPQRTPAVDDREVEVGGREGRVTERLDHGRVEGVEVLPDGLGLVIHHDDEVASHQEDSVGE